jgi:NitT/TauT family transport system substrate-binding protein
MRKTNKLWLAARGTALLLCACICIARPAAAAEPQTIRLVLDWAWLPYHAAFLLAEDKGYFRDAGLDVKIEQGRGSATTAMLVAHGDFDIGHLNITNAAQAIGKGLPMKVVAIYQHKTAASFVGIKGRVKLDGPESLKGPKIGSTPGGSDGLSVKVFAAVNHIPLSSLNLIALNADAKNSALLNGAIDIVSGDSPAYTSLVIDAGFEPEMIEMSKLGVPLIGFGFAVSEPFLKEHGDAIPKFLAAVRRGFQDVAADPKAACEFIREKVHLPLSEGNCTNYNVRLLALSTSPSDPSWGRQSEEEWKALTSTLEGVGEMPAGKPLDAFYTNAYLPKP